MANDRKTRPTIRMGHPHRPHPPQPTPPRPTTRPLSSVTAGPSGGFGPEEQRRRSEGRAPESGADGPRLGKRAGRATAGLSARRVLGTGLDHHARVLLAGKKELAQGRDVAGLGESRDRVRHVGIVIRGREIERLRSISFPFSRSSKGADAVGSPAVTQSAFGSAEPSSTLSPLTSP
jgi:hypothetical protein